MSEINDLIARSSVVAYNSGYRDGLRAGITEERARILELASQAVAHGSPIVETDRIGDYVYLSDLIDYMEEDHAKKISQ